jgi:hypothetical protein
LMPSSRELDRPSWIAATIASRCLRIRRTRLVKALMRLRSAEVHHALRYPGASAGYDPVEVLPPDRRQCGTTGRPPSAGASLAAVMLLPSANGRDVRRRPHRLHARAH